MTRFGFERLAFVDCTKSLVSQKRTRYILSQFFSSSKMDLHYMELHTYRNMILFFQSEENVPDKMGRKG